MTKLASQDTNVVPRETVMTGLVPVIHDLTAARTGVEGPNQSGQDAGGAGRTSSRGSRLRLICEGVAKTARLMVGVPDYETYVAHRQTTHPDQPVMSYEEFFRERQAARYTFTEGRLRGCC